MPRLNLMLPYRERAAVALMSGAIENDRLAQVWTAHDLRSREGLKTVFRSLHGAADPGGRPVGVRAETVRLVGNRTHSPRVSLVGLHVSKALFDRAVAARVDRAAAADEAVLGFPGACERTFARVGFRRKVFHAVDAHPRAHNEALDQHYGSHEGTAERYPEWLCAKIERELRLATDVLVPSELVAEQMARFGVPEHKLRHHPYGVEFGTFAPEATTPPRAAATPRILYVGQLSYRKGIPSLIEAARDLALDLHLVGNAFERRLLDHLPPNIAHVPPLPHAALAREYASADCFVLPTIEDACSLVALEAVATGLPVVTTTMNGAVPLLPPDVVRTVAPGDTGALRQALLEVKPLGPAQRASNAETARTHPWLIDWSRYADQVLEELL